MTINKLALANASEVQTGNLTATNQALTIDASSYGSVAVQVSGTWTAQITFELSNDNTNWYPTSLVNTQNLLVWGSTSSATGVYVGSVPTRYFRVRCSSYVSGTVAISVRASTTDPSSQNSNVLNTVTVAHQSGTSGPQKAEDAAHATGDQGFPAWGVRQPTTPVVPTSAAGDYSYILVDQEGKTVQSGFGTPETSFQSYTALTTTSDVSLKAAGAAGIRNYVTDIILDNTAAATARFILKDGSTTIFSASILANSSEVIQLKTPLKGTAATALNGTLGAAGTVSVTLLGFLGV